MIRTPVAGGELRADFNVVCRLAKRAISAMDEMLLRRPTLAKFWKRDRFGTEISISATYRSSELRTPHDHSTSHVSSGHVSRHRAEIPIARTERRNPLPRVLSLKAFGRRPGACRSSSPALAVPLRWAVVRNPEQNRSSQHVRCRGSFPQKQSFAAGPRAWEHSAKGPEMPAGFARSCCPCRPPPPRRSRRHARCRARRPEARPLRAR
jgi:hypothetical protein